MSEKSQIQLIKEYFLKRPNKEISHPEVVDFVTAQYKKLTKKVFRDPDRAIRSLHQQGFLVKVKTGVYLYDPTLVTSKSAENFSEKQRKLILERDNYKCAVCGRGKAEGMELHIDHIKPRDKGGKATLENGQVLCSQHNFLKKNLNQTESGKKMFINLYNLAKSAGDKKLIDFTKQILKTYEKFDINGHIDWDE